MQHAPTSNWHYKTGLPDHYICISISYGRQLSKSDQHGFGLKDAWQQSRQVLMRWVTVVAVGYAIPQMLAFTDPARLAGLAEPAPWRAPGTRTAGLIQAGIARILREVGLPTFIAAIWGKISASVAGTSGSSAPPDAEAPKLTQIRHYCFDCVVPIRRHGKETLPRNYSYGLTGPKNSSMQFLRI